MAFPPNSLFSCCTIHTQIHKHSHTPVICLMGTLTAKKIFFFWKIKEKKLSLKRLIALIFNLAFTRAYSGCRMLVELHVRSVGLRIFSLTGLCIKCFWISTLSTLYWRTSSFFCWCDRLQRYDFSAASLLHKSHDLRVPKWIGLLYTLQQRERIKKKKKVVVVDQQQTENIASQFTVTATNSVIVSNFQHPLSKGITN